MPRYSHQLSIAFTVESDDEHGQDITFAQIIAGITARLSDIAKTGEWEEAALPPIDTDEIDEGYRNERARQDAEEHVKTWGTDLTPASVFEAARKARRAKREG